MNRLPQEIVHRILEYDGRIKYRHGKYMNQISKNDDRYQMLLPVHKIHQCIDNDYFLYVTVSDSSNRNRIIIYREKHIAFNSCEELLLIDIYSNTSCVLYIYKNQGFKYILTIYKPPTPAFIESVIIYLYDLCSKLLFCERI
jgi:hypothetical protein